MSNPIRPCLILLVIVGLAMWGYIGYGSWLKHIKRENDEKCGAVGLMLIQYMDDHERYPDASKWENELAPYNTSHLSMWLKVAPGSPPHRIAMNDCLSGQSVEVVRHQPRRLIAFFEKASSQRNAHGRPTEALNASQNPSEICGEGLVGYGRGGCGEWTDFQFSSDPKAMGLNQ